MKGPDPGLDAVTELVGRLPHAGEDDAVRGNARAQGAVQLAAADDVGAGAGPPQELQHGEVGVGLDRVGDEGQVRERLLQSAHPLQNAFTIVHI